MYNGDAGGTILGATMDLFDLSGRKALITGASRGIGLAIAEEFARRGANIAITGRKAESLAAVAEQLRKHDPKALAVPCHQGEPRAIDALFEELDARQFCPDIVVINAATNPVMGPLADTDLGAWQKIIDVNLTGAFWTARQAVRRMQRGSILFVASIAGIDPMPGLGAYSVSKAGVLGLVKSLAKELGSKGIRVNALAPGLVETRFSQALFNDREVYERIIALVPLGRHGQPHDIVGAAVFLASDAASYITGQVLIIDGGARV